MNVTVYVKENVAENSGLWPETAHSGTVRNFNSDSIEIDNSDYGYMIFMYADLEMIEFLNEKQ